jgi:integrase
MLTINLEPKEPCLDGRQLALLIDRYLSDCELSIKRETVDGYRYKLSWFVRWWESAGPGHRWVINRETLIDFEKWLRIQIAPRTGEHLSFNSRLDVLRRLRQVFIWAFKREFIQHDLSYLIPSRPLGSPPLRRPLSPALISQLLEVATSERDRAIVAVLAGTGIRRSECAALLVDDVQLDPDGSGLLYIRKGKFNQSRYAVFDSVTGGYLLEWLNLLDSDLSLFGLGKKGIYNVIKRLAEDAGISDQIQGPHDLRRLFIQFWNRRRRGEAYGQLLMQQVGHRSWATTMRYNTQQIDDLKSAFISPVVSLRGIS